MQMLSAIVFVGINNVNRFFQNQHLIFSLFFSASSSSPSFKQFGGGSNPPFISSFVGYSGCSNPPFIPSFVGFGGGPIPPFIHSFDEYEGGPSPRVHIQLISFEVVYHLNPQISLIHQPSSIIHHQTKSHDKQQQKRCHDVTT